MIEILDVLTPIPPFTFDEEPEPEPPNGGGGGGDQSPGDGTTGQGQDHWRLLKKRREAMIAAIMAAAAED